MFYRLAWNFSVGQLSSKVLKSSELVSSLTLVAIETCELVCVTDALLDVGHMFG